MRTICKRSGAKGSGAARTATLLQMDGTAFRRSDIWKIEMETLPFRKELEMAMLQETPDGHGATMEGTSEEGLAVEGFP